MSDAPATLATSPDWGRPDGGALVASPPDISVSDARLPTTYEAAKTALSECLSIDECKDWTDKAQALASYARQADDNTLEKRAMRIRARAIRRAGELLKTFNSQGRRQLSDGGDGKSQGEAAREAGMSERQERTAVRIANIAEPEFEQSVEGEKPPTISELASKGVKPRSSAPQGFKEATEAIGSVKSFAEFCSKHDPKFVAGGVMDYECADLREHVHAIDAWLDRFVINLKG